MAEIKLFQQIGKMTNLLYKEMNFLETSTFAGKNWLQVGFELTSLTFWMSP